MVDFIQTLEVDYLYCVGIGTDECAKMVSVYFGAVKRAGKVAENTMLAMFQSLSKYLRLKSSFCPHCCKLHWGMK